LSQNNNLQDELTIEESILHQIMRLSAIEAEKALEKSGR
jgi:hypothetical protein